MDSFFAEHTIGVNELRDSPSKVLKQTEETDEAVAILNHNRPAGYIVSPCMLDAIADRVATVRAESRVAALREARSVLLDEL